MAAYAKPEDVAAGFRSLEDAELEKCTALLEEAGVIIDAYNSSAPEEAKKVTSCRMVRRVLGSGSDDAIMAPMGSAQGTVSALGYSQTWSLGSGSSGELYLSKVEKKLLGVGNRIGSHSPIEDLTND